ncbi:MAG: peptidase Ste24p [Acidobacteria bacterium]|nr:peptidase Ste24p [Acidobacteriota bacterium]
MESAIAPSERGVEVERWPSELPLFALVLAASLGLWLLLALTILGLVYAVLIGVLLFFAHVAFVTHLRGSAIKIGPEQFPELHARVVELARRAGLARAPDAYLLQAGGSLNALATKLFRGRMIVLFSDLLEACGEDHAARDLVIGHELGHLRSGHLDWHLLIAPGMLVPFLGAAYSRAREFTCDRWGAALCGDRAGATRGLAILAAGGVHGPRVNLRSFVEQQRDLDTGWMTLGRWLSGYPPLAARVAAIESSLATGVPVSTRGPVRAILILAAVVLVPTVAAMGAAALWMATLGPLMSGAAEASDAGGAGGFVPVEDVAAARERAVRELGELAAVAREQQRATGVAALDDDQLFAAWTVLRPGIDYPVDPFDGQRYGVYGSEEGRLTLFSSGPDGEAGTDDDLEVEVDLAAVPD